MPSIHTKTITINNGDDIDATPIEQVHTELYENDTNLNDAVNQIQTQISGTTLTATFVNEAVSGRGVAVGDVLMQNGTVRLLYIRANINSTTTGSAVIQTSTAHNLSTGDPVKYATAPGVNVDTGLSTTTLYYARVVDGTHFQYHPTLADANGNTNPVTVTSASSGLRYLIADPVSTPSDGKVWIDPDGMHYTLGGVIHDLNADTYQLLTRFSGTKTPLYVSATSFSVNRISERDSGNNVSIIKSASTTVSITSTGLNGIAQSPNQAATISVTNGSTAITFSASQTSNLIAGDVIVTAGGQARKLASGSGTSWVAESQFTSTETGVTFKRGGRPSFYTANTSGTIGTCHLNLYAITDGVTPGLILSTRNVAKGDTLVDLPSGYQYSKILPFVVTLYNTSTAAGVYVGNIIPFQVGTGWPYRPKIHLLTQMTGNYSGSFVQGVSNTLFHGTATSYTAVDLSRFVPQNCRLVDLSSVVNGTYVALQPTGGTDTVVVGGNTGFLHQILPDMPISSSQSMDYKNNAGGGDANFDVYGYTITDIF